MIVVLDAESPMTTFMGILNGGLDAMEDASQMLDRGFKALRLPWVIHAVHGCEEISGNRWKNGWGNRVGET